MRRARALGLEIILPIAVVAAWWWFSADSTSPYFSPLRDILAAFVDTWLRGDNLDVLGMTLLTFGLGYALASILGIVAGVLLAASRTVADFLAPLLEFLRALPAIALVPAFISALGTDLQMRLSIVVFASVWPVLLNTLDGIRGLDPVVRDSAQVFRVPRGQRLLFVTLPGASPQIFAGLRVGLALSLIAVIVTEMVASAEGIGAFARAAQYSFDIPAMWTAIILMGIVGYLLNKSFELLEKRILRWHYQMRKASS